MEEKPFDVEAILRELTELHHRIPGIQDIVRRESAAGLASRAALLGLDPVADFDSLALIDAIETMADDVSGYVERKREELVQTALLIYYAAEEAARDPANAHLIPHVEEMRRAYERQYGCPIPPRPEKES